MRTLWVPADDADRVRRCYRAALVRLGWRPGPWRRSAVDRVLDGPTHACLPTGAGTFLLPPPGVAAPEALARTFSQVIESPVLLLSPRSVLVLVRGAVTLRSSLWKADAAAIAKTLGVDPLAVRALLQAAVQPDALAEGAGAASDEVWELVALRVA